MNDPTSYLNDDGLYLLNPSSSTKTLSYRMSAWMAFISSHHCFNRSIFNGTPKSSNPFASITYTSVGDVLTRKPGLNDCTIHTLRHTHATRLIQNGMSVYEVKEILGHSDIKTTMRYAHLEQRDVSSRARDVINKIITQIEKPDLKVVWITIFRNWIWDTHKGYLVLGDKTIYLRYRQYMYREIMGVN